MVLGDTIGRSESEEENAEANPTSRKKTRNTLTINAKIQPRNAAQKVFQNVFILFSICLKGMNKLSKCGDFNKFVGMKRIISIFCMTLFCATLFGQKYIRVNYVGYLPKSVKVAVYFQEKPVTEPLNEAEKQQLSVAPSGQTAWVKRPAEATYNLIFSHSSGDGDEFVVYDAVTKEAVYSGVGSQADPSKWVMQEAYRLDFSRLEKPGGYYIEFKGAVSPVFKIGADVYDGAADVLLKYMRQQQCGYNPFTDTLCHQKDGYIVDHPTRNGEMIDVRGGWHDASDYLQYQTTSATATYDMMFAYMMTEDKSIFADNYKSDGKPGSNGVPDILDQARWGLDWLVKMNPEDRVMFTQIADDRDHIGFKPPQYDTADYGWGEGNGRPVYFLTGKPQGMGKFGKNRTTGVSSAAAKFASSFALGSEVFKKIAPKFAKEIGGKAVLAYEYAKEVPGNTQTACYVSRYFYEEDSWVDDVERAAATLYKVLKDPSYEQEADYYGEQEPISPWMELGRGRHYQFYPFLNVGHYLLATSEDEQLALKYREFMKEGLVDLRTRAAGDPFMHGVPYLWCSNNLTSAAVTQAELYRRATNDSTFIEMEAALRDWLFGCNPWGVSMIIGYPKGGNLPTLPHSAFTQLNREITGGLIDGPVYNFIFKSRAGMGMRKPDQTPALNRGIAVYHNDIGDYATNEPTMDGTASLTYYFASLEQEGNRQKREFEPSIANVTKDSYGTIRRMDRSKKEIYLIFSADSMFNGGEKIFQTLKKEKIKGSFFFTGNALRLPEHEEIIKNIIEAGHYVSGHSDKHLLYAPWGGNRDSMLISKDSILADIRLNARELERFGVSQADSRWFLPPYEHYNTEAVNILSRAGYIPINYTQGTATPADYTIPSMKSYVDAQTLINRLYDFELKNSLNGAIILIHPGIEPTRPESERLYNRLREIIQYLKKKGYTFKSFKDLQ